MKLQVKDAIKEPTEKDAKDGNDQKSICKLNKDEINDEPTKPFGENTGKEESVEEESTKPFRNNNDKEEPIEEEKDDNGYKEDQINTENEAEHPDGGKNIVKCKLCGYSFRKARADIDRSTLAVHFKIMHPLKKRDMED